jgi:hypothetical protein
VAEPNKQAIHFQALENKIKSSVGITALLVSKQLQATELLKCARVCAFLRHLLIDAGIPVLRSWPYHVSYKFANTNRWCQMTLVSCLSPKLQLTDAFGVIAVQSLLLFPDSNRNQ